MDDFLLPIVASPTQEYRVLGLPISKGGHCYVNSSVQYNPRLAQAQALSLALRQAANVQRSAVAMPCRFWPPTSIKGVGGTNIVAALFSF
jgi:hypothetical protein